MYENGSFVKIQKRELQLKVTPIIMLANSVEEQNYRAKSQQIYTLKKKTIQKKDNKKKPFISFNSICSVHWFYIFSAHHTFCIPKL